MKKNICGCVCNYKKEHLLKCNCTEVKVSDGIRTVEENDELEVPNSNPYFENKLNDQRGWLKCGLLDSLCHSIICHLWFRLPNFSTYIINH